MKVLPRAYTRMKKEMLLTIMTYKQWTKKEIKWNEQWAYRSNLNKLPKEKCFQELIQDIKTETKCF